MPEYILLVNYHTIEKVSIEAASPKEAREKGYDWEWEDTDVIKTVDGGVDYVEIVSGEDGEEEGDGL